MKHDTHEPVIRLVIAASAGLAGIVATLGFVSESRAHVMTPLTTTLGAVAQEERPVPAGFTALGFELGTTKRTDALQCAETHSVQCEVLAMGSTVRCNDGGLTMRFDSDGTLIAVDVVRSGMALPAAKARFKGTNVQLAEDVGPPTGVVNERFVDGLHERAERSYRYRGYDATVTATNLGERGVQILERYRLWK
jgi:hypothetical protein